MDARLAALLVRYRYALMVASLLLVAATSYGAQFVWFNADYRAFFKPDYPQLVAHEQQQAHFTRSDNVSFILAPKDGNVFTRETLAAIEQLTEESWRMPRSIRVDSITNFQHSRAVGDDLATSDLVRDAMSLTDAQLAEKRAAALGEPYLVGALISDRGHVSAVNVRLELPDSRDAPNLAVPEVMAHARRMQSEFEARHPNIKVYLMGLVPVNQGFNELAQQDSQTLAPMMFVVVLVVLGLFFRSVSAVFGTLLVIVFSLAMAVGFMGWAGFAANQVNVSAPTLILTLAVSDSVHVLLPYLEGLGQGRSRAEAMEESLRLNIAPVFFTNLTTAVGFVGLNFSDSPPFLELGNIAAFGVMATMVLTFTLLPGVMTLLPVKIRPGMGDDGHWRVVDRICEFALAHRKRLFWVVLAVAAACSAMIPLNDLNDDTVEYFEKGVPLRDALDFVQDNLTGVDGIAYELTSGEQGGINDPLFLARVEAFAQWWRAQPDVTNVLTFTDIIKRLNQNMHGGDPAWYRIPEERDLAAQYVLLYELSLPQGLDLNTLVNFDKSSVRFVASVRNLPSRELIALDERAQAWLAENAPGMAVGPGTGVSMIFAHLSQSNIYSMLKGALVSAVLISLTMILSLRSLKFGLVSLIPNLLPAAIAYGVWGLLVGQVNLAVAAVFSVSSGIVIDDTIHFLSKYLRARRILGKEPADAVRYSFSTTGAALFVNTAVLVLGFLVLTVSNFTVNSSLGMMTALIIAIALFFDLFFLPALLLKVDKGKTA
ncbi:MAG TPA: MMPL family transporter [Verrucomicrobiae bacterium]|nr:MMPL family transporter [Verrucomicrobiae bacterium]